MLAKLRGMRISVRKGKELSDLENSIVIMVDMGTLEAGWASVKICSNAFTGAGRCTALI